MTYTTAGVYRLSRSAHPELLASLRDVRAENRSHDQKMLDPPSKPGDGTSALSHSCIPYEGLPMGLSLREAAPTPPKVLTSEQVDERLLEREMLDTASTETVPSICRLCSAHCGILATVSQGRLLEVRGDPDNPAFKGYTCPKGRALPDMINDPNRLLYSQQRQADGSYSAISVDVAMDEIAAKVQETIERYGPRSVALYTGMSGAPYPASVGTASAWLRAIGTPMFFTPATIDQPGKQIACSAHGHWLGGDLPFETADSWMLVGINPVISKASGVPAQNPAQKLKDAVKRGMKVIVIDPRKTETSRRAAIHLQPRPGEDPTILAGIINIIIQEKWCDDAFIHEHTKGFEELAARVARFTPEYVAERAGISADSLYEATRIFATYGQRGGMVVCGTGPSFAGHANLTDYLALCLNTLCGRWPRAGDALYRPNVMLPAAAPKAQPLAPYPGWGFGERMRVRGLTNTAAGMPTCGLSDEILLEGEGRVRALICLGSNPMAAWPDQHKTQAALESLELLVTLDVTMSATSRLADYVIAPKMTLETPGMTQRMEMLKYYSHAVGMSGGYAQSVPRTISPPPESDVIEEWQFFHGLAKRMDLDLEYRVSFGFGEFKEAAPLQFTIAKDREYTTEELYESMCETARVPFHEVGRHPHGKFFDVQQIIGEKERDCTDLLDLSNEYMLSDLDQVWKYDFCADRDNDEFPFRLINRRSNNFVNSTGIHIHKLNRGTPSNATYMNPDDLAELGLSSGDRITIRSAHGIIQSVAEADDTMRRKVISTYQCFGGPISEGHAFNQHGSSVNRLVPNDVDYDPITGIARMGNIRTRVFAGWQEEAQPV